MIVNFEWSSTCRSWICFFHHMIQLYRFMLEAKSYVPHGYVLLTNYISFNFIVDYLCFVVDLVGNCKSTRFEMIS